MTTTENLKSVLTFEQILEYFKFKQSFTSAYFNQYSKQGLPTISVFLNEQTELSVTTGINQKTMNSFELLCLLMPSIGHDAITEVLQSITALAPKITLDNIKHSIASESINQDFLPYRIDENHVLIKQFYNITNKPLFNKIFAHVNQKAFILGLHNGKKLVNFIKFDADAYALLKPNQNGMWNSIPPQKGIESIYLFTHPKSLLTFIDRHNTEDSADLLLLNIGQLTAENKSYVISTIQEKGVGKFHFNLSEYAENNAMLFINAIHMFQAMGLLPFRFTIIFNGDEIEFTIFSDDNNKYKKMKFKNDLKSNWLSRIKKPKHEHPLAYDIWNSYQFRFMDLPSTDVGGQAMTVFFTPKKESIISFYNYLARIYKLPKGFVFQ